MRLEPIAWDRLTESLADHLAALDPADGGPWPRVALDGPPPARPSALADRLADALRLRGRPSRVIAAEDFLRPASLRFERGHQDPDAFLEDRYDTGALWRELFDPLAPGGTGRVLPDLWNAETDRATRSPYVRLPPGTVVLVHGPLLLGHWFPFDLTVHLRLSDAALRRRTPEADRWTLPAFARYEAEQDPSTAADAVVRADDPRHPAWTGLRPVGSPGR